MPVTNRLCVGRQGATSGLKSRGSKRRRSRAGSGLSGHRTNGDMSTGVRNRFSPRQFADHSAYAGARRAHGRRLQVGYDSGATWRAYAFVQETRRSTATARTTGASASAAPIRLSERLRDRCGGFRRRPRAGGKLGTAILYSDRTNLYLNYCPRKRAGGQRAALNGGGVGNLVVGREDGACPTARASTSRSATRTRISCSGSRTPRA